MDGFERRRNEKKEAILRAALELFGTHGFERVSMSEIATKVRVSKVSIYNYFESKDNLRRVLSKKIMDDSLERLTELVNCDDAIIDKIIKYLDSHKLPYSYVKFFYTTVESDFELKEYYDNFYREYTKMIRMLIEQGKEIGIFSCKISNVAIEIYIDMYMTYITRNQKLRETAELYPQLLEEFKALFLDGLICHGE